MGSEEFVHGEQNRMGSEEFVHEEQNGIWGVCSEEFVHEEQNRNWGVCSNGDTMRGNENKINQGLKDSEKKIQLSSIRNIPPN